MRQLLGAANIEGSPFFHVASGNLGYQVEHHLFPDMPSTRYGEIAPKVRDVCKRYGLPYNTGPFSKQWGSVQRTILRLAFPGGKPRPKPGPYQGDDTEPAPAASGDGAAAAAGNGGQARRDGDEDGEPAATENVPAEKPTARRRRSRRLGCRRTSSCARAIAILLVALAAALTPAVAGAAPEAGHAGREAGRVAGARATGRCARRWCASTTRCRRRSASTRRPATGSSTCAFATPTGRRRPSAPTR